MRAFQQIDHASGTYLYINRPIKRGKVHVRSYVRNGGPGQLSSRCRHYESDVIMRTGAASAVGKRRYSGL